MLKNRTVSGLLLIIFVVVSYFVLIRFVTPLVVDTTSSDLYIEETDDYASNVPEETAMTEAASTFCLNELAAEYEEIVDIDVSKFARTTWPLGNYHYIVKATIPAKHSPDNSPHIMVCEILYDKSSQAPNSADNWTVKGLSYTVPDNQKQ